MLPFKVVFFDLGNTLIYFDGDWTPVLAEGISRMTRILVEAGLCRNQDVFAVDFLKKLREKYAESDHDYSETTTLSLLRSLVAANGYLNAPDKLLNVALDAMYKVSQAHWRVEKDAHSTLTSLHALGCRLGMISNASHAPDVYTLVDQAGLRSHFQKIWVSAEVGFRKPHSLMFEMALDYFQIRPKEAVMVGDTLSADILGANNMGIASIWITRRADTPENRANQLAILPDVTIKDLDELPALLMNW